LNFDIRRGCTAPRFRQSSPFIKFRFDFLSAFKQRIESRANYRNDHAINPALL
jgi:hypothetical protein